MKRELVKLKVEDSEELHEATIEALKAALAAEKAKNDKLQADYNDLDDKYKSLKDALEESGEDE